jgi:hypothetical protein
MDLTVVGQGFSSDRVDAMQTGLDAMGQPDASVIVTDDFVDTVCGLTDQSEYSTRRGHGVVGARTVFVDGRSTIVVNAQETRGRSLDQIERLLAHEAGHAVLNDREEGSNGLASRRGLVPSEWEWWLLCIGGLALDELRIERSLADLGYPAAETATGDSIERALHQLNVETMNALRDPASADVEKLREAITRTHDWFAKHLAYFAAPHPALTGARPAGLSTAAGRNWDDYVGSTWQGRIQLYDTSPTALEPASEAQLNDLLREGARQEAALLERIGFRYVPNAADDGFSFLRVISDAHCMNRIQRAQ